MNSTNISCPSCQTRNRVPVTATGKPRCAKCHTDLPWLVDATSSNFKQIVASSSLPILLDLWAPWCGPCRTVAPALEELTKQRAGSVRVIKVNLDEQPAVSAQLGIKGIPTMVLYRDGKELARQVGALPAEQINRWVDTSLSGKPGPNK